CLTSSSTTDTSPLSLHDALPILALDRSARRSPAVGIHGREHRRKALVFQSRNRRNAPGKNIRNAGSQTQGRAGKESVRICHRSRDRKSTRLNSSHRTISYAVFCL